MTAKRKIVNDCEMATFFIEKSQFTKLTPYEYCYMTFHLAFCSMCRMFQKQSKLITEMTKKVLHLSGKRKLKLDKNFKKQLQAKIEDRL